MKQINSQKIQIKLRNKFTKSGVKMIGPEPSKFSGMSARIDTFIESLNARLATVPMF